MTIAITGATGFLGRYIVRQLVAAGHTCRCAYRPSSDRGGFDECADAITWVECDMGTPDKFDAFCDGADAVVHAALYRPIGAGFRAAPGVAFEEFVRLNLTGSLSLMNAAKQRGVSRFVFIATCAVHEVILQDRKLDEAHPLWPTTHYGAHKAAIEKFVHSYGLGEGWPVCSLRPTGIYGVAHPASKSRWFEIVRRVARGEMFQSDRGGKEVHAADVARATEILLSAPAERIAGQAFNCYDMYIAEQTVAVMAKEMSGSNANVAGNNAGPKNQIDTTKIQSLGMDFGGEPLLRETVQQLLAAAK